MATIASLIVEISAKSIKLKSGLTKATSKIKDFAKRSAKILAGIGAAVSAGAIAAVGAVVAIVNKYATQIDKLAKTSSKLGVTVEGLQRLQYQAELTGVSADTMNMALQRMVRRVSEAAKGTGAAKDALKELGLSASQLNKLSPDKQFYAISEAMKSITNQGDKVRLAMKIFDTEGVSLVNTMNGNLQQMGAEFDSLGISITGSAAKMVESYNDSKTRLGAIFSGFGLQLTAQLAEPFKIMIDWISKAIIEMGGMEAVANRVALAMLKSFNAVAKVITKIVNTGNNIKIGVAESGLAGAAKRLKTKNRLGLDTKDNVEEINKYIDKIKKLKAETSTLGGIDDLIAKIEKNITDNKKIDMSDVIKPEHYAALDKTADKANQVSDAMANTTSKVSELASAAEKAAKSISQSGKTKSNVVNLSDFSSRASENASAFDKMTQGVRDGSFSSENSGSATFRGRDSSGLTGNGNYTPKKIGAVQDYINSSSAGKRMQELREKGAFGSQEPLGGNTKITLNMVTDAGKVSGELIGNQKFIDQISKLQSKQTNKTAKMAAQ